MTNSIILDSIRLRHFKNKLALKRRRSIWVRPGRTSAWWDNLWSGKMDSEAWKENLRMNKTYFLKLCGELETYLQKESQCRPTLSVEKQVAMTLYYLSDEGRYRKVANAFGVARSTLSIVVRRVCAAIVLISRNYIKLPQTESEVLEKVTGFQKQFGIPQCLGAIDGTHIGIKMPTDNSSDYKNRKFTYSINVQATCDYRYCFFDVVVKWPGSVHDTRIFLNSEIHRKLQDRSIPPCPTTVVPDEEPAGVFLLADPGYPLLPHVMKEYPGGGATKQEQYFGLRLCSARIVIECAFGRLKGRFGALKRPMDINLEELPNVILACLVLHNFCEMNNQSVDEQRVTEAVDFEKGNQPCVVGSSHYSNEGKRVRNLLSQYLDP